MATDNSIEDYYDKYCTEFATPDRPFGLAFWLSDLTKTFWWGCGQHMLETLEQESRARDLVPLGHLADAAHCDTSIEDEYLTLRYKGGDVVISLAPFATDDLVLPSQLLAQKSPWFKAALRDA